MTAAAEPTSQPHTVADAQAHLKRHKRHRWLRRIGWTLLVLLVVLVIVRLAMPSTIRWYVNRTLDRNPLYDGQIGDVTVHLYRGAYSIENVQLIKTTGNVPVPLFAAKRVDLGVEWGALMHGRLGAMQVLGQLGVRLAVLGRVPFGLAAQPAQLFARVRHPGLQQLHQLLGACGGRLPGRSVGAVR